jgi:SAM-dependent methyltransferase
MWFYLLVLCSISLIFIYIYKTKIMQHFVSSGAEGFTQKENFVLKCGDNTNDEFYSTHYEKIHKPKTHLLEQIDLILKTTQVSLEDTILDIGSNTGYVVNELTQRHYNIYGLTSSPQLSHYCKTKYPDAIVKAGDLLNPMEYDKAVFTHIFALYYTIYNFKDKTAVFRNCYSWMKPGGYLVIHVVDVSKFDITTPIAKDVIFGSIQKQQRVQNAQKEIPRMTEYEVDLVDMKYKSSYNFNHVTSDHQVIIIETMQDKLTNKIRQNEKTLYMESIPELLRIAQQCGFIAKSTLKLKDILDDEYQYLYVLERTL